ncbi:SKP1-like protein 1B [Dendrobium catenatum]|uniref:SKP1-like protein n=1 Tax=Dendrobium catenatum TaxID=906689 RepID=A0A2I0XDP0_9ASPA|nr:SKP1-like protein 1B [Dendrobium catenatum]PKU86022.1 SKP1-like protein 11 [Dendrobium catenatum]
MSKKIKLKGSDGKRVVVEEEVAMMSETLRHIIEDNLARNVIPISNVTSTVLSYVFQYCKRHLNMDDLEDDLEEFDNEFVDVDVNTLYDLLMAANYLNVKDLLYLVCRKVADLIRGKTPEEIRLTFNIENDLTPEQEEEIRQEHSWAFD